VVVLFGGCATSPNGNSFNFEYRQDLATKPYYYIKNEGTDLYSATHFTIVVHQGVPSRVGEGAADTEKVAATVAADEAGRLGWEKWHMDYIDEHDEGWMHVVVARVTHDPGTAPTVPH
jgi:hypothetical protein